MSELYNLLNIKIIAERKKTTIREIAIHAGISDTGLHKSISKNSINIETLCKIAEFLNVSVSELINDKLRSNPVESKDNEVVYKKLVSTQEELIQKQEKMYNTLEKDNKELKKQVEQLKNEVELSRGYSMVATPPAELKNKK